MYPFKTVRSDSMRFLENTSSNSTDEEQHMMRTTPVITILAALTLAACSGGGYGKISSPPPPPPGNTITATPGLAFGPASLTVGVGDAVTFDFQSVPHNVFFDALTGAPADITGSNANVSVQRTFTTAGTYHYSCHIHPSMQGTVVVR
jgi:plastocyanin